MKRGRILTLFGIILGLITTVAAFLILQGSQQPVPTEPTEIPKVKVLVALQNVSKAQPIDPGTLELREFEQTQVPSDAVYIPADVNGKLAAKDISQGQIIRASMLTDKETIIAQGVNASFVIPPGKVAIAFPIDKRSSVAYALEPGDSIDMLITMQFLSVDPEHQIKEPVTRAGEENAIQGVQEPRMVSQLTVQDATVLRVGPWGEAQKVPGVSPTPDPQAARSQPEEEVAPQRPDIMTVLVDQQDALVMKFALESGASVDFALRGRGWHDIVTTEPVTLEYMMRRFNITPAERMPYMIEPVGAAPAAASQ